MRAWLVGMTVAFSALGGCQFDPSGLAEDTLGGDAGGDGAGSTGIDATADATPACIDGDSDGAFIAGQANASCPGTVDCDDGDARARPGQEGFFETPRASGGFDFNCDGRDEPYNATLGGACRDDWFECVGTGWATTVPACGATGTWHVCEPTNWGCMEASSMETVMPCR